MFVEEGGGRTFSVVLRSASASWPQPSRRSPWAEPLRAGELISTGSLTTPMLIAPGETWRAEPEARRRAARDEALGKSQRPNPKPKPQGSLMGVGI